MGIPAHEATTRHLGAVYPFLSESGLGGHMIGVGGGVGRAGGVLVGRDLLGSTFGYDPFELYRSGFLTNPNMVVIGQIGRGKSAFVKTYLWRMAVFGRRAWVVDPKGEYGALARAWGVEPVALRPGGPIRLNPLDAADEDDAAWLSCLLWPGETGRAERLSGALATARRPPPALHRGDLLDDLPGLAAQAPPRATLVVYHSAVLAYVDERKRQEFATAVRRLGAVWLSNEAPGVLPDVTVPPGPDGSFVLVRDGTQALARTDPHGTWLTWLP